MHFFLAPFVFNIQFKKIDNSVLIPSITILLYICGTVIGKAYFLFTSSKVKIVS